MWRSTVDPSLPPPAAPYPLYRHELDTGTLVVAEDGIGTVVGFGASITRDQRWLLADLFVDPGHHGGGLGRALLDALVERDRPGAHRVTMASSDPRALSLYSRLGLTPRWPCFALSARSPRPDPARGATLMVEEVDGADLVALTELSGHRLHRIDLDYWAATLPLACVTVRARRTGSPVGAAVVRWATPFAITNPRAVSLGPALAVPSGRAGTGGPEPADVLAALLRWIEAQGHRAKGAPVRLYVPGSHPWLNPALDAGFHITDFDLFCASDPALLDPTLACPSHDLL